MHLLVHTESNSLGGHETNLRRLLNGLRKSHGVRISLAARNCVSTDFLSQEADATILTRKTTDWVKLFHRVKATHAVAGFGDAARFLRAAKLAGVPSYLIASQQANDNLEFQAVRDVVATLADKVIVPSYASAHDLHWAHSWEPTVIANGIDTHAFHPRRLAQRLQMRIELGLPGEAFVLVCASRIAVNKNHSFLIRLISQLRKKECPAHLLLLSPPGEEKESLKEELVDLAQSLGVISHVQFFSSVPEDMPRLFAAADVYVSCAENESFSCATAEAMAMGLPCIVTRTALAEELKNAQAIHVLTQKEFPETLLELFQSSAKRKALGTKARQHITHHFSVEKMISSYWKVLNENFSHRRGL